MKKRIVLLFVSAALLLAPLWGALTAVYAAGENLSASTYQDVFTENFENGIDRWQVEKLKDTYTADFEIVTEENGNKVLTHTRNGIFLVPKDEFWPGQGVTAGQLAKVTFRMKFVNNTFDNKTQTGPILSYRDAENFSGTRFNINYAGGTGMHIMSQGMSDGQQRGPKSGGIVLSEFDNKNWFTVTCVYIGANIEVTVTDSKGVAYSSTVSNYALDGKFAVGNRYYANNNARTNGNWYMDDLRVEFAKLSVDKNEEQKDINIYYAGNTFVEPGETVMITGEQLGKTADSQISLIKLPDTAVSANAADYIGEQNHGKTTDHLIPWATLTSGNGSLRQMDVAQTSDLGLKFVLPNDAQYSTPGVYAVYVSSKKGGEGAISVINNPEVNFLLHDDGDAATPNGWLKLSGSNLSVQNDITKVSAVIIDSQGNRTMVPNGRIYVDTTENNNGRDNDYYMQVNLTGMTSGSYKIMVHNGYGGDYAWSEPVDFTVRDASVRSQWEKLGVFNVTDFGAKGDSYTNDTGAIIAAMAAAEKNGGGIVYFPACNDSKAFYRITDSIYVPDNVTVLGDGSGNTNIFIDTIGNVTMPESFFYYQKNFAVEGINIYGHVMRTLFRKQDDVNRMENGVNQTVYKAEGGHVYFKDITTMIDASAVTSSGKGTILEGYDNVAAVYYTNSGNRNGNGLLQDHIDTWEKFVSLVDVDFFRKNGSGGDTGLSIAADYIYMNGEKNYSWSNISSVKAGFLENCGGYSGASLAPGNGNILYRNCTFQDGTSNNRELLCNDGHSKYIDQTVENLSKIGLANEKTLEELLEKETDLNDEQKAQIQAFITKYRGRAYRTATDFTWSLTYCRMYITDGQGAGQQRLILQESMVKIGGYLYFAVEEEFAVDPNRNSKITFYADRTNWFVTNCDFANGRHVGPYGTIVNAIFDGNTFNYSSSGTEIRANSGNVWYLSAKENVSDNIMTGHSIYVTAYASGMTGGGMASSLSFFGISYRDNTMGNGGYYEVGSGAIFRPVMEVLFEDNNGVSDSPIFRNVSLCEGMWLRNNTRYTQSGKLESAYDEDMIAELRSESDNAQNKYGSFKAVCDAYAPAEMSRPVGDVNNDGLVTYEDVRMIQQHIAGVITLTDADKNNKELTAADLTKDGVVDMKDIIHLTCLIEGKVPPTFAPSDPDAGEDFEDESDEYLPGHW